MPEDIKPPAEVVAEIKVDESKLAKVSLESSIEQALETETKKTEVKVEEEITPEVKVEEKKEEVKPQDDDTKNALLLYNTLKDPEKGLDALMALARAAGLKIDSTKEEKTEVVKTIKDLIKEEMGDEFAFMGDKLGNAIEKAANLIADNKIKDIRKDIEDRKIADFNAHVTRSLETVITKFNVPEDVQTEMTILMKTMSAGKGTSVEEYYTNLAFAAAGKLGKTLKTEKVTEKQEAKRTKNTEDANTRLSSERGAVVKEAAKTATKMSLTESIQSAVNEVNEKLAK